MVKMHRHLLETDQRSMSPAAIGNKTTTNDAYINEMHFDTNMVIILGALLCALICALGLNSIVRCALRCSRRLAAARLAATGLKKRELRQIPVAAYRAGGVNISATVCAICLGEFVDGEKVRVLPNCNHGFHVRCIDTWLVSHSSCPNCRHSLLDHTTKIASSCPSEEAVAGAAPPENESGRRDSVVISVEEGS